MAADSAFIGQLLNSIGDAVVFCDDDKNIVSLNNEAQLLLVQENLIGKNINKALEFTDSDSEIIIPDILEGFLQPGDENIAQICRLIIDKHNEKFIHYTVIQLSEFKQYALILRDISEDYLIKLRLQESENMQSLGRLTGGIAHDFNNMLGSIMGATQILDVHLQGADEKIREYVQIIMRVSEHAAELVRKLSAFSRREAVSKINIEVNDLIKQVISIANHAIDKRISISHSSYKNDLVMLSMIE